MSGPPVPPKKKNHQPSYNAVVGAGHNAARSRNVNNNQSEDEDLTKQQLEEIERSLQMERMMMANKGKGVPVSSSFEANNEPIVERQPQLGRFKQLPNSSIGKGVEISGEFEFEGLLQIDGKFHGKLLSSGDLIVCPGGCVMGDITTIKRMVVNSGHIHGNISVEELLLLGNTVIKGNISCKLLEVIGPDVSIFGRANVHPLAPELVDENDNIITTIAPKPKKVAKAFAVPIVLPPVIVPQQRQMSEAELATVTPTTANANGTAMKLEEPSPNKNSNLTAEELSVENAREKHLEVKNRRAQQQNTAETPASPTNQSPAKQQQQQQQSATSSPAKATIDLSAITPTTVTASTDALPGQKQPQQQQQVASPPKASPQQSKKISPRIVDFNELSTNEHISISPRPTEPSVAVEPSIDVQTTPAITTTTDAPVDNSVSNNEVPTEQTPVLEAEQPISLLISKANKNNDNNNNTDQLVDDTINAVVEEETVPWGNEQNNNDNNATNNDLSGNDENDVDAVSAKLLALATEEEEEVADEE